jgi:hypothetical protein
MNKINVIYNQLIDYIVYTLRASPTGVLNGKLNIKNNNIILAILCLFSHSKGSAKQNAKISFLSHKCYSYISLKKSQNQQSGATKKINQLHVTMWKKNNIKLIKK